MCGAPRTSHVARNLPLQSVADLPDGEDVARRGGVMFELAAELGDVRVHRAGENGGRGANIHAADDADRRRRDGDVAVKWW